MGYLKFWKDMDTRKAIEELGLPKKDYITPSQVKKTKKVARRRARYDKHVTKQIIEQQTSGKLIEENHNGYDYSHEFTSRAISWHLGNLWMKTNKYRGDHEKFLVFFRGYREKFQTLLLHWAPSRSRDWSFWFIMDLLDTYRELKETSADILWDKCAKQFINLGLKIK